MCKLAESNRFGGAVGTGAWENFDATGRVFAYDGNDSLVFVVRQRGAFAGGPDWADDVGAGFHVKVHERSQRRFIDPVVFERRDESHRESRELFAFARHFSSPSRTWWPVVTRN